MLVGTWAGVRQEPKNNRQTQKNENIIDNK